MADTPKVNVLYMASEADPLIKVGGLGDVAGSLPRALQEVEAASILGSSIDARLVIPLHPGIRKDIYPSRQAAEFAIHYKGGYVWARAYSLNLTGLVVYLIGGAPIEQASGVYSADLEADSFKYVFFSLAALELARRLAWRPDVLHANDWHTAAAVYSLALNRPGDLFFRHTASLLTIHNLPYLGAMTGPALEAFDLPAAETTSLPAWAGHMALPLGLLAADRVVAVSPGYSREIMTDEFGSGLQAFLRAQAGKVTGILNGLNTVKWDPSTDVELAASFSITNLSARAVNKAFLQR
ncbi:MAG: glycogen synthase, partial [Acidobacteriaceae bacterium]